MYNFQTEFCFWGPWWCLGESESENKSASGSFMSYSLGPNELYGSWNFPCKNTGVVAFPFSRGSSQPRDRTQVSFIAGRFFTSWATREAQEYWSGYPIPSSVDLPDPGIEPGSPALQVDSLPRCKSSEIVFTDVFYLVDMSQFIHSSWKGLFKKVRL